MFDKLSFIQKNLSDFALEILNVKNKPLFRQLTSEIAPMCPWIYSLFRSHALMLKTRQKIVDNDAWHSKPFQTIPDGTCSTIQAAINQNALPTLKTKTNI